MGYGTWVRIGKGRTLIGEGTGASLTARTAGATGGAETHQLTVGEMPSHDHGGGDHTHTLPGSATYSPGAPKTRDGSSSGVAENTGASGDIISSNGGDTAHNNMQPYLVVYIWERTA